VTSIPDKAALRARMRSLRRTLAAADPDAPQRLERHLPSQWIIESFEPDAYSLYHPIGSELDPRHLRFQVGDVALPVAVRRDAPLVFRVHSPGDPLEPDAFGIPSPTADAREVLPDIVFAPVLAFDSRGGRLGQGAGHYDRTIANLRALKPVLVIGVAYAGQEVAEVPMEPHDQRLDAILTETGYIQVG